ncbi:MAG: thiamine pyrophosphate-dependent enzyme, partial [candidate division KSB1 bacterium]|nr:thiamine pyrophosphate-dependent enzyme [candidate division KSB1 bacterium]
MTSIDRPVRRGGKKPLPEVRDDVSSLQRALRTAALSRKLAAALQASDATAAARFAAAGHEAIQLALAVQLRPGVDRAFLYHRDQAALLQLGVSAEAWLQAVRGSDAQLAFAWPEGRPHGLIWQRAPQPDWVRDGVAAAAALKAAGGEAVVVLSAGDGLAATGAFHEALTWAARERLPAVFLIQDNHASAGLSSRQVLANSSIFDLTAGYRNLERFRVDGSEFQQCRLALEAAYRQAVRRKGPALIVADVDTLADLQLTLQPTLPETTPSGQRDPVARLLEELRERMDEPELTDWLAGLETELNSEVEKAASAVVRTSVVVGSPAPADIHHILYNEQA